MEGTASRKRKLPTLTAQLTPLKGAAVICSLPLAMLDEPERIAIGVVHVKLARTPTLIDRTFMNFFRGVWIPGRAQPSLPKLPEDRVNVVGRHYDHLTEFPVARVAGEEEPISVARQDAEGRVREIVITVHALEIEHAGVERQRRFHVSTADSWEDCHNDDQRSNSAPAAGPRAAGRGTQLRATHRGG